MCYKHLKMLHRNLSIHPSVVRGDQLPAEWSHHIRTRTVQRDRQHAASIDLTSPLRLLDRNLEFLEFNNL